MKNEELEVCDACGVTAEFGYMISEGDDVAEVTIYANNREEALQELRVYNQLANEVNAKFIHDLDTEREFEFHPLKVKYKFECSAEKIIFELRSRSLSK